MEFEILALLSLGFAFGLLHALDADHVMAVSSLASSNNQSHTSENNDHFKKKVRTTLIFCTRWAIGHGGILCLLAGLLLAFNLQLPAWLTTGAEKTVGVILIALGTWIFWTLKQGQVRLRIHKHGDHVHAHLADDKHDGASINAHTPTLVGLTHGLAGSAPVLALLPTLELSNGTLGFAYVLLFSVGVLCMMFIFGLGFGYAQSRLLQYSARAFEWSRAIVAGVSISLGSYWLFS